MLGARVHLGHRDQHVILQMRIVAAEIVAADDAVLLAQVRIDLARPERQPHHEFLEERLVGRLRVDRKALELADLGGRVMALVEAELGDLPRPLLAHRCQIDGGAERAERGIGADIARRLGAANMLFARGQREHVAAPAVGIDRLADQMAGQPTHMRHARGKNAEMRAAERRRNAERWPSATTTSAP